MTKINLTTLIEKLEPTQLAEPIRLGTKSYIVLDERFGVFTKKEATFLASLFRQGLILSVVIKALQEQKTIEIKPDQFKDLHFTSDVKVSGEPKWF